MSDEPMSLTEGEEPLVGMLRPDLSAYSEEQLRAHVIELRTIRSSSQSRAARIEAREKKLGKVEAAESKERREALFDDLTD